MPEPVIRVEHLTMHYTTRKGDVHAVDDVSFDILPGEVLGVVGESGSGKSSVAFTLMRLLPENAHIKGGHVWMNGVDLITLPEEEVRKYRWKRIAMIFQAAMNTLNPVYKVGDQIIEAMENHGVAFGEEARKRVAELFQLVGLDPALMDRYPHEYSGGMRQRAIIAMALSCDPDLLIADEPTTALDVIVQHRILQELLKVQKRLNMAMMYITHDIAVVAEISTRMAIMYAGKIVEIGSVEDIFLRPKHRYTEALLKAFPSIHGEKRELITIPGELPNLLDPPVGCRFHPRCPFATNICREREPEYTTFDPGHIAACWHPVGEERA